MTYSYHIASGERKIADSVSHTHTHTHTHTNISDVGWSLAGFILPIARMYEYYVPSWYQSFLVTAWRQRRRWCSQSLMQRL